MISLKQPYQLSTTQKAFLTSGTFCCYLLLCPSHLVSLREFSPKYKGPRQPSEARWEQSDLRPLLSSQPIAPPWLHIKILLIRSVWSHADFILVIHKQFTCFFKGFFCIFNVLQGIYYLNNELKWIKILTYFKFTYFLLFILIIIFTL